MSHLSRSSILFWGGVVSPGWVLSPPPSLLGGLLDLQCELVQWAMGLNSGCPASTRSIVSLWARFLASSRFICLGLSQVWGQPGLLCAVSNNNNSNNEWIKINVHFLFSVICLQGGKYLQKTSPVHGKSSERLIHSHTPQSKNNSGCLFCAPHSICR